MFIILYCVHFLSAGFRLIRGPYAYWSLLHHHPPIVPSTLIHCAVSSSSPRPNNHHPITTITTNITNDPIFTDILCLLIITMHHHLLSIPVLHGYIHLLFLTNKLRWFLKSMHPDFKSYSSKKLLRCKTAKSSRMVDWLHLNLAVV